MVLALGGQPFRVSQSSHLFEQPVGFGQCASRAGRVAPHTGQFGPRFGDEGPVRPRVDLLDQSLDAPNTEYRPHSRSMQRISVSRGVDPSSR